MKKPAASAAAAAAEAADDEVISRFTQALLHGLVGSHSVPHLITSGDANDDSLQEVIPEVVHPQSVLQTVPRLMPQANRFDELPTAAAGTLMARNDFMAHTAHMKKIFKLMHSKAAVELMVHRVGNTIVLDGVLDHFMDSWAVQGDEWTVVDEECLEQNTSTRGPPKRRSSSQHSAKHAALQEAMASNFLYYSRPDDACEQQVIPSTTETPVFSIDAEIDEAGHDTGLHGFVDESECQPAVQSTSAIQASDRFRRVFNWRFEGLDMLLASNHMIWSSEEFPALSLRLHDAEQELGSMNCLDYWIQNTMESIDASVLCFHRDGLMQGYEVVRTEELPTYQRGRRLADRLRFSPEAVLTHAQSVLRFLQANCERDGGTYLLSRDQDTNVLELYELTEYLATTKSEATPPPENSNGSQETQLPRTLARKVALLCGRMAKNISDQTDEPSEESLQRCRRLYQRCADMLDPAEDWLLWSGALEGVGNTHLHSGEPQLFGLCGGGVFPEGCPDNLTVDTTREKHETQAELSRFLAAGEAFELALRQQHAAGQKEDSSEIRQRRRLLCNKTVRVYAAAASCTLQSQTPQLGVAFDALRVAMACLPDGPSYGAMRGGLLVLTGWMFASAAQLGVPNLLLEHKAKDVNGLDGKMHPLHGELQEGSIEEVLNRGSMCYLAGLKMMGHTDAQFPCAVEGLGSAYVWLGEHYLETGRFTKAHRYYMQGVELFKSLFAPVDERSDFGGQVRRTIRLQVAQMRSGLASTFIKQASVSADTGMLQRAIAVLQEARMDSDIKTQAPRTWNNLHKLVANAHTLCGVWMQQQQKGATVLGDQEEKEMAESFQSALEAHSQMQGVDPASHEIGNLHHHLALHYAHRTLVGASKEDVNGKNLKTLHALSCNHFGHALHTLTTDVPFRLAHLVVALDFAQLLTRSTAAGRIANLDTALWCLMRAWDVFQEGLPPVATGHDSSVDCCNPKNRRYAGSNVTQVLELQCKESSQELWSLFEAELQNVLKAAIAAHMQAKEAGACEELKGIYREMLTYQSTHPSIQGVRLKIQGLYNDYVHKHSGKTKCILGA